MRNLIVALLVTIFCGALLTFIGTGVYVVNVLAYRLGGEPASVCWICFCVIVFTFWAIGAISNLEDQDL